MGSPLPSSTEILSDIDICHRLIRNVNSKRLSLRILPEVSRNLVVVERQPTPTSELVKTTAQLSVVEASASRPDSQPPSGRSSPLPPPRQSRTHIPHTTRPRTAFAVPFRRQSNPAIVEIYTSITELCSNISRHLTFLGSILETSNFLLRIDNYDATVIVENVGAVKSQLYTLYGGLERRVFGPYGRFWGVVTREKGIRWSYSRLNLFWTRFERFWEILSSTNPVIISRVEERELLFKRWAGLYSEVKDRVHDLVRPTVDEDPDLTRLTNVSQEEAKQIIPSEQLKFSGELLRGPFREGDHHFMAEERRSTLNKEHFTHVADVAQILVRLTSTPLVPSLPKFHGYSRSKQFDVWFVYEVPPEISGARTLLDILDKDGPLRTKPRLPLIMERVRIGFQIAQAMFTLSSGGMVHKSIWPGNVVMPISSNDGKDGPQFGVPLLFGAVNGRLISAFTYSLGEPNPLYVHPTRQIDYNAGSGTSEIPGVDSRRQTKRRYSILDDAYSLGVTLLEIGIWHSLLKRDVNPNSTVPNVGLLKSYSFSLDALNKSIYDDLLVLTRGILRDEVGPVYASVVEWCLTRIDVKSRVKYAKVAGNGSDGLAMEFIDNVLVPLNSIIL